MNPGTEPIQENPASPAQARESRPTSLGGSWNRSAQVALPDDYGFPADAVAAAKAKGLTEADITKALEAFKRKVGSERRSPQRWADSGAAYLDKKEPAPVDEMVMVGGGLSAGRRCKVSEVRPWWAYRDAAGIQRPARMGRPTGRFGMATAV